MPNRLAQATSPYLLQHQDNPVDWYEWGEEAFAEARRRDVPILLSVGYAACHWCHVMAHESFEDPETAALMNRLFVNVKVDREERPDVDSIYMEAVQAMTGQGGWPMTVWLDHQGRPFFAGTYFPKEPRPGMPTFRQVIEAIAEVWRDQRDRVAAQAESLVEAITRQAPPGALPTDDGFEVTCRQILAAHDSQFGGFGRAPKFPQQPVLEFLLRVHDAPWATGAGEAVALTLERMAKGGIHDHLGGGFARYSVDRHWLVPHFEKMLYDNAQLARLYLWAGMELDRPDFLAVARHTLEYMLADLRHPDGGFYSSEDADSEGVEGKFYVWSLDEFRNVLGSDAEEVADLFGVSEAGNFEGANILHIAGNEPPPGLEEAKRELFKARSRRVRPGLDDKVVASWNGLAIRAFAEAGAALGDAQYLGTARKAARFVRDHLVVDGVLMRSWREGRTSVPAFLDDHAAMALGFFSLYAATAEQEWYRAAMELVAELDRFANPAGGFYDTPDDGEPLVKRPVDQTDNPLPSGSAMAAEALVLASLYTGESVLREKAETTLAAAGLLMAKYPSMVAHHLSVAYTLGRSRELAVVGSDWPRFAAVYWRRFRPEVALAPSPEPTDEVPLLAGRGEEGHTLAYVCRGFVCDLPTDDPEVLAGHLA
ncbi:MAG: thioredoxin domain-containing protein [Acidimicrobiia bacterium]